MHGRIRRYGLLTNEPVEQVFQGVREGFPIIKNAPGFLAYYTLIAGMARSPRSLSSRIEREPKIEHQAQGLGRGGLSSALPTSASETIVGEVGAHELNLIKLGIREILE